MRRWITSVLMVVAGCAPAGCATAAAPPERTGEARTGVVARDPLLRLELAVPTRELRGENDVLRADRYFGAMPANAYSVTAIRLPRGSYVVRAACDGRCRSMRLRIATARGVVAGGPEREPASHAGVRLDVPVSETHDIRVDVLDCSGREPCEYGIAVFTLD